VRILLICPIPIEFMTCRTALSLRDGQAVQGCRTARGLVGNVDVMAIETGPAKARAAAATVAGISHFQPDLAVDTGTCGALDGDLIIRAVVVGTSCLEYDISGGGMPSRIIAEMRLPSAFDFLPRKDGQKLVRELTELGKDRGLHVRAGVQACGEFFIQSPQVRESLLALSGAAASNWETAGVFVGSLRSRVPPLSLRIVSDLGDEDSFRDFRRNARKCSQDLYRFVRDGLESGWFVSFHKLWKAVPRGQLEKMPQRVLP
jgi:adenosylhomocysteine nucleosidase